MRALLIVLTLLFAFVPAPGAAAAPAGEDPQGDVEVNVLGAGTSIPAPTAQGESADLLSLDITEDAEALTFGIQVVNLEQQVNFLTYEISFVWGKAEYRVGFSRQVAEGVMDESNWAYLYYENDEGWNEYVDIPYEVDLAGGVVSLHVPKAYILSENGRYPLLGDKLEELVVEARSHTTLLQFTSDAYDRMPDGEDVLSYSFLFGDLQAGHIRLDADERVRVSNGGATTFVYKTTIRNTGEVDDQVTIELTEMPEGWNGTVQSPIRIPADSERTVAILVSTPFAHAHGGFSSFNVTARSERDPNAFGSVRMGVLHTPIPQPAGHHQELCLHAKGQGNIFGELFPWTSATMNTECELEGDAPEATPAGFGNGFTWNVPLDPGLRMGLDFDVEGTGEVAGSITGRSSSTGKLFAELQLVKGIDQETGETQGILLAESDEVDMTFDLSTPQPFKLTLTPTEDADYVPYARGQNLVLMLRFESDDDAPSFCCLGANTPGLHTTGFKMQLPLNEYSDRLTGLSESAESLELKAEGVVEKAGYAGATLTYAFTLVNHHTEPLAIRLDAAGTDAALGTIVPADGMTLGPKESAKVTLAVSIPVDRNEGEEIEVLLFAHAQEDPSKTAIARTKTLVVKPGAAGAVGDETGVLLAAQAEAEKDTPLGPVVALAALAAVALALRRRAI